MEKPEFIAASRDPDNDYTALIEFDRPIDRNVKVSAAKEISADLKMVGSSNRIIGYRLECDDRIMRVRFKDIIGPSTELRIVNSALKNAFPRLGPANPDFQSFKAGDVVMLKSGGWAMVIEQINEGSQTPETYVSCLWQSGNLDTGSKFISRDEFQLKVLTAWRSNAPFADLDTF